MALRAPLIYFGGKSRVAPAVWNALGSPSQYIEPFCGSAAVLLAKPGGPATLEVIGDMNGFVANFWRAAALQPAEVARWADWPVIHVDLHARHDWLLASQKHLAANLADPDWPGDAKAAGWWLWGQCAWIGSGWCDWGDEPKGARGGEPGQIPYTSWPGRGILSPASSPPPEPPQTPFVGHGGRGIHAGGQAPQIPFVGHGGMGIHAPGAAKPVEPGQIPLVSAAGQGINGLSSPSEAEEPGFMTSAGRAANAALRQLAARLERVRILHGSWDRTLNHHYGGDGPNTAVFLDPPYAAYEHLYGTSEPVSKAVGDWARDNPKLRIALCGHEGEHDLPGWRVYRWSRGRLSFGGDKTTDLETIWFSPACLSPDGPSQQQLFG